jgi:hypothetical protein
MADFADKAAEELDRLNWINPRVRFDDTKDVVARIIRAAAMESGRVIHVDASYRGDVLVTLPYAQAGSVRSLVLPLPKEASDG